MSKWVLNGITFDINPNKDSGWFPELVSSNQHMPGANYTLIQVSGRQSETRNASGITKSPTVKANLLSCIGEQVSFTDHYGISNTVFVESVVPEEVIDITNLGVGTFSYSIKMLKVA